jgi:hypothetical protein
MPIPVFFVAWGLGSLIGVTVVSAGILLNKLVNPAPIGLPPPVPALRTEEEEETDRLRHQLERERLQLNQEREKMLIQIEMLKTRRILAREEWELEKENELIRREKERFANTN